jgi:hypothetical protein
VSFAVQSSTQRKKLGTAARKWANVEEKGAASVKGNDVEFIVNPEMIEQLMFAVSEINWSTIAVTIPPTIAPALFAASAMDRPKNPATTPAMIAPETEVPVVSAIRRPAIFSPM